MALPQGRARADTCNDGVFNAECEDNAIRLFTEGDSLFDAMLSDFMSARQRVWLESYIFVDDAIGSEFINVLSDCSRRGLDVRVRVDALGSVFGFSGGSGRAFVAATTER